MTEQRRVRQLPFYIQMIFTGLIRYGTVIQDEELEINKAYYRARLWTMGDDMYKTVQCNGELISLEFIKNEVRTMDFVEWLKEVHDITWEEYDRMNDYMQKYYVDMWNTLKGVKHK